MRRLLKQAAFILAFFAAAQAFPDVWSDLEDGVVEHELGNGMRFLIFERHETPLVSFVISVKAGSVNEVTNKTGIAHLLEHLAFNGTRAIGTTNPKGEARALRELDAAYEAWRRAQSQGVDPAALASLYAEFQARLEDAASYAMTGEFSEIYERNGGTGLNAGTSYDHTSYVVTLPSNRFELWAAMESDRLMNPVFRGFYEERDVVQEERRQRTDNSPSGLFYEEAKAVAYKAHPYGQPIIGHASDIAVLTRADVEDFYSTYYVPQHMTAAIVGDVDADEIIPIIDAYFSRIPRRPDPPEVITREPEQTDIRRVEIRFPDTRPRLMIDFQTVPEGHPDERALDLLGAVLGGGRSSRLYRALVEARKIASYAGAGHSTLRYAGSFTIWGGTVEGVTAGELEQAVLDELEKLKRSPITHEELDAARGRWEVGSFNRLASNRGMAYMLAYSDQTSLGWRENFRLMAEISKLTPQDLMRVAERYLVADHRTVAIMEVEND